MTVIWALERLTNGVENLSRALNRLNERVELLEKATEAERVESHAAFDEMERP